MQAHLDRVNCCVFHPSREELYSGGNDYLVLVWTPLFDEQREEEEDEGDNTLNPDNNNNSNKSTSFDSDEDNWSDDDLTTNRTKL